MTLKEEAEIWKPVIGAEEHYEVSSYGRVRSIDRILVPKKGPSRKMSGKVLSQGINKGYYYVLIHLSGKGKSRSVHSLVAQSFFGHIPEGHKLVVDHIDGNRGNNHINNLQVITHRRNRIRSIESNSGVNVVHTKNGIKRFRSKISIEGKLKYLGVYDTREEAQSVYDSELRKAEIEIVKNSITNQIEFHKSELIKLNKKLQDLTPE